MDIIAGIITIADITHIMGITTITDPIIIAGTTTHIMDMVIIGPIVDITVMGISLGAIRGNQPAILC
jgi:hypothetical protein